LANDGFDPDADVEVTEVTDPANGTVTINADGTVTYTPDPNYNGTDTFDYTVTVTNPDGSTTTETATVTIIVTPDNPSLELLKDGVYEDTNGDGIVNEGDSVVYTFTVTNNGDVPLFNITITDPLVDIIGGPIDLDPTESDSTTFTAIYAITQDNIDAGGVYNQATVNGVDQADEPATDDSEDPTPIDPNDPENPPIDPNCPDCTITVLPQDPSIAIIKVGVLNDENGDGCSDPLETITYTFTVTNEGNVTLSDITVLDAPLPIGGITFVDGDTDADGELDVDETWTYTGSYAITQDDIDAGQFTNQATVEGIAPEGTMVSDLSDDDSILEDDPTVTEICQDIDPDTAIAIIKVGVLNDENGDGCSDPLETITYTFTVTNQSNVSISDVVVLDAPLPIGGITFVDGDTDADGELDVDETWTYTGSYAITQDDIDAGQFTNQATVEGVAADGTMVSDLSDDDSILEDDPTVTEICQDIDPDTAIAIIKVGVLNDENGDGCSDPLETITYTFTVTNQSNVSISDVVVLDAPLPIGGITFVDGDTDADGELDVDETWTYTGSYAITQDDIDAGQFTNQATVEGVAADGTMVSDLSDDDSILEDDPTVTEICQDIDPDTAIAIIKVGVLNDENGDGCSDPLETITYTFTVTNQSNVSISDVVVLDAPLPIGGITFVDGDTDADGELDVDETWTYTGSYAITQDDIDAGQFTNQATVEGIAPEGTMVSDLSDDDSILEDDPTVTEICQDI
ncbi:Ig-like domain-containing protein, partial [uncultured Dokdonia sp.]|uniref:Ig-like domain-containing protein n=1 Tax=uncultured Dokdonia sp. TaxID=575653 RepID=UPI00262EC4B1